jgi:AbrB family looped-hinge helix DNA binding protein
MVAKLHTRVTLGEQGRIVVPAEMRRALGLRPGDQLVVRTEDNRLLIEKVEAVEQRLLARFAGVAPGVSLVDELLAERREWASRQAEG